MTEIKELVARLREDARQMWNTGLVPEGSTPLAEQAASTIEALSSQVEELREALKPFARQAQVFDAIETGDDALRSYDDGFEPFDLTISRARVVGLTIGDIRKARALASEQTGG